ncbi:hypothetical protein ABT263_22680 [Kitasatospora sp. NPDC001603]|uniref:hypothetical protein n=1 Tax=Kitasatospora sp. NPDC001603 TaxID=3154388 RepID=UPI0033283283
MEILDVLTGLARTGHLGPVANGVSLASVTAEFGEPWVGAVGHRDEWPRLVGYGDLELAVCRCGAVVLVCLQTWREVIDLPPALAGRPALPGQPSYTDVIAALDRAGCPWRPYPALTFEGQRSVEAEPSGAVLTFEIVDDEEPALNVVCLPPHHHDCPTTAAPPGS